MQLLNATTVKEKHINIHTKQVTSSNEAVSRICRIELKIK